MSDFSLGHSGLLSGSACRLGPAGRLFALVERTRKELLGATDPSFIHHAQYSKALPKKNVGGAVYKELRRVGSGKDRRWEAVFSTGSATFPGVEYEQRVVMEDLDGLLRNKRSRLNFLDKVRYAISNGDLKVSCGCPAHLYWGYKYIDTNLGVAAPGMKEFRPPDIRNPQRRGIVCKHLDLCLHVLPSNASFITHDLKNVLGECFGMERLLHLIS